MTAERPRIESDADLTTSVHLVGDEVKPPSDGPWRVLHAWPLALDDGQIVVVVLWSRP